MADSSKKTESQIAKFREAARELETDDREENFDAKLKRIAKSPAPTTRDDKKSPRA